MARDPNLVVQSAEDFLASEYSPLTVSTDFPSPYRVQMEGDDEFHDSIHGNENTELNYDTE